MFPNPQTAGIRSGRNTNYSASELFKTMHKQSMAQKKAAPRPTGKEKEEMLKKGFAVLEERLKLEKGSLSFTGKTEGRGTKRHYQLAIKG